MANQRTLKQSNMVTIVFSGTPISTNSIYKRGRGHSFYMTDAAKTRKEQYQWEVKKQYKNRPLEGTLGITVDLRFKDKRKHDIDNYNKLLFDACNGILWKDDSQIAYLCIFKNQPGFSKKTNPSIRLRVWKIRDFKETD